MISKLIASLSCLLIITNILAQEKASDANVSSVTKITVLEPGIAHEFPLGNNTTLFLRGGVTATLATDYDDAISGLLFRMFGSASGRYYYNFEKREGLGKNTDKNSANYFAFLFLAATEPLNKGTDYDVTLNNFLVNTGIVWGLQRNYPSRFSLDLNVGIGYVSVGDKQSASVIGELNIGFWLGKK